MLPVDTPTRAMLVRRLKALRVTLARADERADRLRKERTEIWVELRGQVPITELAELSGITRDSLYQFFERERKKTS
jgi:hypothetical protein